MGSDYYVYDMIMTSVIPVYYHYYHCYHCVVLVCYWYCYYYYYYYYYCFYCCYYLYSTATANNNTNLRGDIVIRT